jgi:type II secretory pathway pseudopilin PulG
MAVMVIIAILAAITLGSAQYIIRTARQKRYELTRVALETALSRYRHEYNAWPIPTGYTPDPTTYRVAIPATEKNAEVFDMLRDDNGADNPHELRFLDETTLLTEALTGGKKQRQPMVMARRALGSGTKLPIVFVDPQNGTSRFYRVTFNVNDDTVKVE